MGPMRPVLAPVQTAKPSTRVQNEQYGTQNNTGRLRTKPTPIILQPGLIQGLEHTANRQTQRLQQAIQQATAQVKSLPFAQGIMLENISLVSGEFAVNPVKHGLPQAWRGVHLMTPSAECTYVVGNLPEYPSTRYFIIAVSADITCDLWVW